MRILRLRQRLLVGCMLTCSTLMLGACTNGKEPESSAAAETIAETGAETGTSEASKTEDLNTQQDEMITDEDNIPDRIIATVQGSDDQLFYGVIDRDGNLVIPFEYTLIKRLRQGYSARKTEDQGGQEVALDFDGNPADFNPEDMEWEYIKIGNGDFYKKYSEDYTDISICRTADDAEVLVFTSQGDFRGHEIVDTSGRERLFFQIEEAGGIYFVVYDKDLLRSVDPADAEKAKITEKKGRTYIPEISGETKRTFDYVVYSVSDEGKERYGMVDSDGNILVEPTYLYLNDGIYSENGERGMVAARDASGMAGYIDDRGNDVIPFQYKDTWPFYNGFAVVTGFDGVVSIIDTAGTEICQVENSGSEFRFFMADFAMAADGHTAVRYDGTAIDLSTMLGGRPFGEETYSYYPVRKEIVMVQCFWPDGGQQIGLLKPTSGEWVVPLAEEGTNSSISMDGSVTYFEYEEYQDTKHTSDYKALYNQQGNVVVSGYERLILAGDGLFLVEMGDRWCWYDQNGQLKKEIDRMNISH